MDPSSRSQNDHHIGRRVRELYRYFQPEPSPQPTLVSSYFDSWAAGESSVSDNATVPAVSTASVSTPHPAAGLCTGPSPGEGLVLGNPNQTLNSFAQLAAMRLGVQRVLISVSDRDSQHILANSTQSLDTTGQTDGWSGLSTFDHTWSICKATVALPPSTRNPPQYRYLVVDDMSKDDRYASLPFVQGEPGFRFYAGTPLTTETKINIGCFFVLDTQPRSGLTDAEKETLGSLGIIIMDYLKISRQAHEGRRATRLSRGLSCFVEGGRSLTEDVHPSYMGSPGFSNDNSSRLGDSLHSGGPPSRRSHSSDTRSVSSESESKADSLPSEWGSSRKGAHFDETHDTSWPFKRAANILRESLELGGDGGVILLEAGNNPTLDSESGSDSAGETGNPAPTLAISTLEDPFGPSTESKVTCPTMNLDHSFLLRLFRRYSKGRLWGFHRDGMLSSSDDDDDADEPRLSRSRSQRSKTGDLPLPRSGKGKWKAMENKLLNQYFPNACQVLFVPLWNAGNSQWFSGCFCWTTVETRVFSPSVELSSVLGFGSSIMADYSRIQSLISDRQKGDFIGSISHELRSPLHGILAAAEFLQGTQLDEFQGSLLETVNACGRTLLDTMNQVLDFSKIVSLERTWRNIKRHKASPLEVRGMEKVHLDSYVSTDLAVLAEEVVEGVCLGHSYGQRATASTEQPVILPHNTARGRSQSQPQSDPSKRTDVEVMVDIAHNDWVYRTQPGALRRILMNILGNAMKYTDFGRVSVQLEATEASESRLRRGNAGDAEDMVTLTVSDTGRGISEEFMRARLYTPFAQEDSLAVGTGLGMSIVRSLVRALNGSVNAYSRPDEGTMIKVTLPLERPQPETKDEPESPAPQPSHQDVLSQARLLRDSFAGRRVSILGVDTATAAQHPIWSIIVHYVTEWYGLELVSWPPTTSTPVDLVLADEQMLAVEQDSGFTTRVPALLVLCNKSDYGTAKTKWAHLARSVEMIPQPSGPHKLARLIRKSLDSIPDTTQHPMSIVLPNRTVSQDTISSQGSTASLRVKRLDLTGINLDLTSPPELTNSSSGGSTSSKSPESESEPPMPYTATTGPLPLSSPYVEKDEQLPTEPHSPTTTVTELPHIEVEGEPDAEAEVQAKARVLVVDDNSINLKLMMTFMKKRDLLALDAAENGKIAVDAVERMQGYDLIFLDMSMPVMDGFEAARTIRSLEKENHTWPRATIIALTGLSSPKDEADALASGVDLFLTKPVSFKSVAGLVDEWEEKRGVST